MTFRDVRHTWLILIFKSVSKNMPPERGGFQLPAKNLIPLSVQVSTAAVSCYQFFSTPLYFCQSSELCAF